MFMRKTVFFLFSFALCSLACAFPLNAARAAKRASKSPATVPAKTVIPPNMPGFCIFGAQSGKPFGSDPAFKSVIWKSDVIYAGETHGQVKDHQAQLEVLKTLRIARGSKIAVGFEMLNTTLQPVLDDYAAGKMTEEEFLLKTNWVKDWGFDFSLYRPLFEFIIQNKLRALALNVPANVLGKVAGAGMAGLDTEDKKFLPETVSVSKHAKYLEFLRASYTARGDSAMAKLFDWDNHLASVAAWDEGMGSQIAAFANANPGWSVVVITGNAHIMYNAGLPASVKSRTNKIRQASFYSANGACPAVFPKEDKDTANYMWYIDHSTGAANGK